MTAWSPDAPWSATNRDVVAYLCGLQQWWSFHHGLTLIPPPADDARWPRECLYPDTLREIVATVTALAGARPARPCEVEVAGPARSGRRTLLCQAAAALGRPALIIDGPALGIRAVRTARLLGAVPVRAHAPPGPRPRNIRASRPDPAPGAVNMVARAAPDTSAYPAGRVSWRLPDISRPARLRLWSALAPGHPAPAAVRDWTLTPAEIAAAAVLAPAGQDAVAAAARRPWHRRRPRCSARCPARTTGTTWCSPAGCSHRLRELDEPGAAAYPRCSTTGARAA